MCNWRGGLGELGGVWDKIGLVDKGITIDGWRVFTREDEGGHAARGIQPGIVDVFCSLESRFWRLLGFFNMKRLLL